MKPVKILDRRLVKKGNQAIVQVLIQWTTKKDEATSWEDWNVVAKMFPELNAWGMHNLKRGQVWQSLVITESVSP